MITISAYSIFIIYIVARITYTSLYYFTEKEYSENYYRRQDYFANKKITGNQLNLFELDSAEKAFSEKSKRIIEKLEFYFKTDSTIKQLGALVLFYPVL